MRLKKSNLTLSNLSITLYSSPLTQIARYDDSFNTLFQKKMLLRRILHRARGSFSDFAASLAVVSVGTSCVVFAGERENFDEIYVEEDVDLTNWSNTHALRVGRIFYPSTTIEVENIVSWAHDRKQKLRPTGNGLSPNGNSFSEECMINLANCDRVIEIDTDRKTITVEGGATVTKILKALKEFNLTLENFSSIQEQQIAGWTQVAAHGTW